MLLSWSSLLLYTSAFSNVPVHRVSSGLGGSVCLVYHEKYLKYKKSLDSVYILVYKIRIVT